MEGVLAQLKTFGWYEQLQKLVCVFDYSGIQTHTEVKMAVALPCKNKGSYIERKLLLYSIISF